MKNLGLMLLFVLGVQAVSAFDASDEALRHQQRLDAQERANQKRYEQYNKKQTQRARDLDVRRARRDKQAFMQRLGKNS